MVRDGLKFLFLVSTVLFFLSPYYFLSSIFFSFIICAFFLFSNSSVLSFFSISNLSIFSSSPFTYHFSLSPFPLSFTFLSFLPFSLSVSTSSSLPSPPSLLYPPSSVPLPPSSIMFSFSLLSVVTSFLYFVFYSYSPFLLSISSYSQFSPLPVPLSPYFLPFLPFPVSTSLFSVS